MVYIAKDVVKMLSAMNNVFDVARIVNPWIWKICNFDSDGNISYEDYSCYRIWQKEKRCLNCISMKALNEKKRFTKYEFVDDETYYVVSKPVDIKDNEGITNEYVLEIVANITDEVFFNAIGKNELVDKIIKSEKLQYIDSLTKAYNRRYFDEKVYLTDFSENSRSEITFIVIDMKKFKNINDEYGHDTGDEVLRNTAKVFISSVRNNDSVIRMGGDEFLIVLQDCNEQSALDVVQRIKESMKQIIYDSEKNLHAKADFGIAYTDSFVNNDAFIANLIKKADKMMYESKRVNN
ncbi:MAG: Diguanylate cyclase DosC [Firmicutes bacterium ADurb.Bin146]|jgi:putative two-component system response regulator|nr:MAG: Diguanylate cyclase DosC [Firmicutes bacterium ADurb.Bin146]